MPTGQHPQRRETDDQQAERVRNLERERLARKVVVEMRKTPFLVDDADLARMNLRRARHGRGSR